LILAVVVKDKNKHIGNVSLQDIDYISRSAEFAVMIGDKESWGMGYAREAAKLIISHGFLQLNLNRVYCGTSSSNVGMQKVAQTLGMIEEGRRREAIYKHGKFHDIIEYGILKKEFLATDCR